MIPAALLVIAIPLVGAAVAYVVRRWNSLELLAALLSCGAVVFLLARSTASVITLPGLIIDIDAPLNLIGRTLRIRDADRLPLLLVFAGAAVVFAMSWRAPQGWSFIPIGLAVLAAMSAGLMIRPFVYAALAFEAAAALAALMIQGERNGEGTTRGALRYLAITTLALPMFVLAGWVIDRAGNVNLADIEGVTAAYAPAIVLLLVGFALIMGALPLFTWVHPVAKDAPPLTTAFLGSVALGAITFLLLEFWQEYAWLRNSPVATTALATGGVGLLVFSGVLAWAQSSFARIAACAILLDAGCTLLVMSSNTQLSVESIAFGFIARALSLGLFCVGMWRLREVADNDAFDQVRGKHDLWTVMALGIGGLSLAGLPSTLGFVSRWATARAYSATDAESLVLLLLASASVGIGVVRGLMALYADQLPMSALSPVIQPAIVGDQLALFDGSVSDPNAQMLASDEDDGGGGGDIEAPEYTQAETALGPSVASTAALGSVSARFVIGVGVALVLILGLWPGIIAPLAQAVAAQYSFYR